MQSTCSGKQDRSFAPAFEKPRVSLPDQSNQEALLWGTPAKLNKEVNLATIQITGSNTRGSASRHARAAHAGAFLLKLVSAKKGSQQLNVTGLIWQVHLLSPRQEPKVVAVSKSRHFVWILGKMPAAKHTAFSSPELSAATASMRRAMCLKGRGHAVQNNAVTSAAFSCRRHVGRC